MSGWLAVASHPFFFFNMKLISNLFLLLAVSLFAVSCSEDSSDSATLTATTSKISKDGESFNISVATDGSWTLTSSATWLTLSAEYGTDENTIVTATAKANKSTSERSATITLKSGTASDAITVTQEAAEPASNDNGNESSTDVAAGRIEIPALNSNNLFVVHRLSSKEINYSIEWNNSMKHAQWAAFVFNAGNCVKNASRSNNFDVDPDLPTEMQTNNSYFTNDGFDRGHLCASYDRFSSQEANNQTFYFSNMSPQLNEFNAGIWQALEEEVQSWGALTATGKYDTVYVAKGGTLNNLLKNFTGSKKGQDNVIPTTDADGYTVKGLPCPAYYFMAILARKGDTFNAIGFILPHSQTITPIAGGDNYTVADIKPYAVSIDNLEEQTGLDFFCNLSDDVETSVEATLDLDAWNW